MEEAAAGHPWMLYAALITGIGVTVAVAVPQILGPIGKAIAAWARERRAAAAEADDADIAEQKRQIAYLEGVAAERLRELRAFHDLIAAHSPWDYERYNAALKAGQRVDPPPPLMPQPKGKVGPEDYTPGEEAT